jgi:hypothetical protein
VRMQGVPHYPDLIICDFCGRSTRGVIYPNEPDSVKCTSCHMELTDVATSVVVNGEWKNDQKRSLHSTDIVTDALNHLANNDLD